MGSMTRARKGLLLPLVLTSMFILREFREDEARDRERGLLLKYAVGL